MSASDFKVVKELGSGSYGVVYEIVRESGEHFALKVVKKKGLKATDLVRTRRECTILTYLRHPHIARVLEATESERNFYIVMELVAGGGLYDFLVGRRSLTESKARIIVRELVSAIAYCHLNNVAHRDIKLENILLDAEGHVKLIDFGLCNFSGTHNHGMLSTLCGSPAYTCPEIMAQRSYKGSPADIWSLGVVAYGLVAGVLPFGNAEDRGGVGGLTQRILSGEFEMPSSFSDEFKSFCRVCLAVDPAMRATAIDLLNHPWVTRRGTQPPPETFFIPQPLVPEPDVAVVKALEDLGFPNQVIMKELSKAKHTGVCRSLYHLMVHVRAEEEGGTTVTQARLPSSAGGSTSPSTAPTTTASSPSTPLNASTIPSLPSPSPPGPAPPSSPLPILGHRRGRSVDSAGLEKTLPSGGTDVSTHDQQQRQQQGQQRERPSHIRAFAKLDASEQASLTLTTPALTRGTPAAATTTGTTATTTQTTTATAAASAKMATVTTMTSPVAELSPCSVQTDDSVANAQQRRGDRLSVSLDGCARGQAGLEGPPSPSGPGTVSPGPSAVSKWFTGFFGSGGGSSGGSGGGGVVGGRRGSRRGRSGGSTSAASTRTDDTANPSPKHDLEASTSTPSSLDTSHSRLELSGGELRERGGTRAGGQDRETHGEQGSGSSGGSRAVARSAGAPANNGRPDDLDPVLIKEGQSTRDGRRRKGKTGYYDGDDRTDSHHSEPRTCSSADVSPTPSPSSRSSSVSDPVHFSSVGEEQTSRRIGMEEGNRGGKGKGGGGQGESGENYSRDVAGLGGEGMSTSSDSFGGEGGGESSGSAAAGRSGGTSRANGQGKRVKPSTRAQAKKATGTFLRETIDEGDEDEERGDLGGSSRTSGGFRTAPASSQMVSSPTTRGEGSPAALTDDHHNGSERDTTPPSLLSSVSPVKGWARREVASKAVTSVPPVPAATAAAQNGHDCRPESSSHFKVLPTIVSKNATFKEEVRGGPPSTVVDTRQSRDHDEKGTKGSAARGDEGGGSGGGGGGGEGREPSMSSARDCPLSPTITRSSSSGGSSRSVGSDSDVTSSRITAERSPHLMSIAESDFHESHESGRSESLGGGLPCDRGDGDKQKRGQGTSTSSRGLDRSYRGGTASEGSLCDDSDSSLLSDSNEDLVAFGGDRSGRSEGDGGGLGSGLAIPMPILPPLVIANRGRSISALSQSEGRRRPSARRASGSMMEGSAGSGGGGGGEKRGGGEGGGGAPQAFLSPVSPSSLLPSGNGRRGSLVGGGGRELTTTVGHSSQESESTFSPQGQGNALSKSLTLTTNNDGQTRDHRTLPRSEQLSNDNARRRVFTEVYLSLRVLSGPFATSTTSFEDPEHILKVLAAASYKVCPTIIVRAESSAVLRLNVPCINEGDDEFSDSPSSRSSSVRSFLPPTIHEDGDSIVVFKFEVVRLQRVEFLCGILCSRVSGDMVKFREVGAAILKASEGYL